MISTGFYFQAELMLSLVYKMLLQRVVTAIFFISLNGTLLADQKPFAPEFIENVPIVTAEQVIEMIISNPELIVIDSRKKSEFLKGHIEGAINILNTRLTLDELERVVPDSSTPILFYCNGTRCLRSSDSINKVKHWGYDQLFWFRGGWKEWSQKRLPVVTD